MLIQAYIIPAWIIQGHEDAIQFSILWTEAEYWKLKKITQKQTIIRNGLGAWQVRDVLKEATKIFNLSPPVVHYRSSTHQKIKIFGKGLHLYSPISLDH